MATKVEMVQGDALEVELPSFDRFISNVPYSISSPLIFRLLEHEFKSAIIMVQKEFADRMVAAPDSDDYSRLTVSVYYRAKCERLEQVPRNKFWPEPEVDSTVLRLTPRPPPFHVHDEELFFRLVEMLFGQRSKKIGTVLKQSGFSGLSNWPAYPSCTTGWRRSPRNRSGTWPTYCLGKEESGTAREDGTVDVWNRLDQPVIALTFVPVKVISYRHPSA